VLKIERRQADMFTEQGGSKHLGMVSNDFTSDPVALVRWHYRKAGCIEVVHDMVKNELGGGVLPCAAFGANAAWFRLCLLTYNLLSAMKVLALPPPAGARRPAARPRTTARRLGGLNALLAPPSGCNGQPTSLGSQSTASS
jgi:hypothetical protein